MSPARPPVAAASPAQARPLLAAVERELARYVGPLAAALVPRAARHHATLEALAQALLPLIESPADREAFARAMARLAAAATPRAAAAVPAAPAAPVTAAPRDTPAPLRPLAGPASHGALLRAADAALASIVQQRQGGHATPPAVWREQLRTFEADAAAHGATPQHIPFARALLDDFHAEATQSPRIAAPGDPLQPLERLGADPAAHAPLLELGFVCIALGYQGHWRGRDDAAAQLGALAARWHQGLPANAAARTLSPRWRGFVTRGPNDAAVLPLWVAVALGIVASLALWFALNARLDAQARPVLARIAAVPSALQAPAHAAPKLRLAALLPAALDSTPIEVRDEARRSMLTLPADALFAAGTARIEAKGQVLLARVAEALRGQPGEVTVIGHGDDAPAASLQYPSNWHFTRARAQAVADALRVLGVPGPRAEGRAEFEPRSNDAAERGRNRRIEIELRLPRPEEDAS